jgi:2-enoate reductase
MQTNKYYIAPAKKQKTVAVIGGGIGGMETAIVCAKRGHKVTLYEKSDKLGGVFIAAAAPSFKEKDRDLITWYRREIAKYPQIEVKLQTEVKDLSEIKADEVVIATGSRPNRIPVPGVEKAVQAIDFLLGTPVGQNVTIIGGGLTGCEIAYELHLQGKNPTIVEMMDDLICTPGICLANTSFLRDFFKTNNVPVYLEHGVAAIEDGTVLIRDKIGAKQRIAADSVILSTGYKPQPLAQESKHVHLVGDCSKVGNLRTVIWQVWDVAMKL